MSDGWERDAFDGRPLDAPRSRRRRVRLANHGPDCSSNPEIGCVCDEEERYWERAEAAALRGER